MANDLSVSKLVAYALETLSGLDQLGVPKLTAYALEGVGPDRLTVPKLTAYAVEEWRWPLTLTNPAAEAGDMTGWTNTGDANFAAKASPDDGLSGIGTYLFIGDRLGPVGNLSEAHQDLDLDAQITATADPDLTLAAVDDSQILVRISGVQGQSFNLDTGHLELVMLGAGDVELGTIATPDQEITEDTMVPVDAFGLIEPGTRTLRVVMVGNNLSGSFPNIGFDDIRVELGIAVVPAAGGGGEEPGYRQSPWIGVGLAL
jgi:hypothetical protein